jgi:hypothetical protein
MTHRANRITSIYKVITFRSEIIITFKLITYVPQAALNKVSVILQ